MKIIFFGTPEFAAHILEDLAKNNIHIVATVTKPDKQQGRELKFLPPAVKTAHEKLFPHIPIFQPPKCSTPEFVSILQQFDADLFVFVAYGEIIKKEVLELPRFGCINVHASLLPKYRGASPIRRCLMQGEKETGISIIQLVKEMDAGDVLYMEKLLIPENMIFSELEEALCKMGSRCLLKTLSDFEKGSVSRKAQNHVDATFAHKIPSAEYQIDLSKSARDVHNHIRALSLQPGAWLNITVRSQKKRMKILRSEVAQENSTKKIPGSIEFFSKDVLAISCGQGVLSLKEVQLEGKKAMNISEFMRGFPVDQLSFISSL